MNFKLGLCLHSADRDLILSQIYDIIISKSNFLPGVFEKDILAIFNYPAYEWRQCVTEMLAHPVEDELGVRPGLPPSLLSGT